jgi:UDP-N-acetylmuramoyl-L-alanyl-D-glutamate--2,6-diaminopimelate ligase
MVNYSIKVIHIPTVGKISYMNIEKLLTGIQTTGISLNATTLKEGEVFVALQGSLYHGIDFVDIALENGASMVLVENKDWQGVVPSSRINNLKKHLPALADYFYPEAKQKKVIAVTGTNGKTSVVSFIAQLLSYMKRDACTVKAINHALTTPDIFSLYKILHQCDKDYAILEASSHALVQGRILGLTIMQMVFTNLTQDHLDYHKSMDDYLNAKLKLLDFKSLQSIILNQDDDYHLHFAKIAPPNKTTLFSLDEFKRIQAKTFGFLLQKEQFAFEVNLLGHFNLSNILAAFHAVVALGFDKNQVILHLTKLHAPLGRMQKITNKLVWVDYAHTPDALDNAITTLQQHYPEHKMRVVFGCGGDRDKNKRAKMGRIASSLANSLILTNDNPRSEEPQAIIDDILSGIDESYELDIIQDRQLAIETAVSTLEEDECLLIAGKGHETTQVLKDKTLNINDIIIAHNAPIKPPAK